MLWALRKRTFSLRTSLARLCTSGAVFGSYLTINARHVGAPFMFVIPLITASAGLLACITNTWKSFLAAVTPSSARLILILAVLKSGRVVSSAPSSNVGMCGARHVFPLRRSTHSIHPPSRVSADLRQWLPSSLEGRDVATSVLATAAPRCKDHCNDQLCFDQKKS